MIFTLGNTSLKLSFSFITLTVVMLLMCDETTVLYSLASSFVHETGHLFFMILFGTSINKIELTMFGIRIDRCTDNKISYFKEFIISVGGNLFNLTFAAFCCIMYICTGYEEIRLIIAINIIIVAVNTLPVSALDCTRAIRNLLLIFLEQSKCDEIVQRISYVFIIIFFIFSVAYINFCGINVSLVIINLYLIFITVVKKWS